MALGGTTAVDSCELTSCPHAGLTIANIRAPTLNFAFIIALLKSEEGTPPPPSYCNNPGYCVVTPVRPCISFDSPPWQLRQNCATALPPARGVYWPLIKNMVEKFLPLIEATVMLC